MKGSFQVDLEMNDKGRPAIGAGHPICVAVDWGTTRFRAHLVAEDGSLIDSVASDDGMSSVRDGAFEAVLSRMCSTWLERFPRIPVLMAGMVGSRNGWQEVPYVTCPAGLSEIAGGMVSLALATGSPVHIVPGLTTDDAAADVMRGEETQILGSGVDDAVVILPGTHSKWAVVRAGRVETFRTFMTGEFYSLLTHHSVLRLLAEPPTDDRAARAASRLGTAAAAAGGGLLNLAFHARTGVLAGRLKPQDVEPYLSGLLIGEELAKARGLVPSDLPLVLVANGVIADHYREAIEATGGAVSLVDPERTFVDGLLRIARHNKETAHVRSR
jgi:2-dehydro-3-deoxygalactonokinase